MKILFLFGICIWKYIKFVFLVSKVKEYYKYKSKKIILFFLFEIIVKKINNFIWFINYIVKIIVIKYYNIRFRNR